jgi:hypothetical protein
VAESTGRCLVLEPSLDGAYVLHQVVLVDVI